MHAGTVILEEWLRHEGHGLAVLAGDVLSDVFVDQKLICHAGERGETHTQLRLTGSGHLVVMDFHRDSGGFERHHNLAADAAQRIGWRNREITALGSDLPAEVLAIGATAVPPALVAIDMII